MLALLAALILQPLQVSFSEVDITPPELLSLGGYTERQGKLMEPGGEHLYARCVLLEQGQTKLAIVSAEMLTIPESLAREVRARIPKDVELFLCATHTHCAPDSQMLNDRMTFQVPGIASYKPKWLKWYADKIAGCLSPSALGHFYSNVRYAIALKQSRLVLNRGRRLGAEPDTMANSVIAFPIMGGAIMPNGPFGGSLFFEYAAHPVFYGPERNRTSGDWPGELSRRLDDCPILMGAIGDVSPAAPGTSPGEKIDNFCDTALAKLHKAVPQGLPHQLDIAGDTSIALDKPVPHPDFIKDYKVPAPLAQTLVEKFAPTEAHITAFCLGSLAVVGIPGEPTSHLGRRIRDAGQAMGFKAVLVISHANGWMGYILDANDYARGGYEATLSFYGPNEGDHVVDAAIQALKGLKSSHPILTVANKAISR